MAGPSNGVSTALDSLLARFGEMVRRVGLRHRLYPDEVDEVLQEMRVRLWRAHGTGEQIAAVSASYVYRTALTAALGVIRRRRSRWSSTDPEMIDSLADADALGTHTEDPSSRVELSDLAAHVARAIDDLPPARQAAVRLHLSGYGRREIAELMRWSDGRTRNLLYRGLSDLRDVLAGLGVSVEADVS
jgi:RNA polymerase sigma-70 factor (ECF subfamily)